MKFIKSVVKANGYPLNFVEGCINRYLSRCYIQKESVEPVLGPERKKVFMKLPFVGCQSVKLKRQLDRLVNCIAPWVKLNIVFCPAYKLSSLSKLKCALPLASLSNVVYKISCADCCEFYIGKTQRRLSQRIREHRNDDCSALKRHALV